MSALSRRLARLERGAGLDRPPPCAVCGMRPGQEFQWKPGQEFKRLVCRPPRVIGEPVPPEEDPANDYCRGCGRQLVIRVKLELPTEREESR